jgi:hypothetical protein
VTTDATRAKTARDRRNRTYPLRVRLQRGRVVHAARTDRMYVDGAGMTFCLVYVQPEDEQLPAETAVTCVTCLRRKNAKEGDR